MHAATLPKSAKPNVQVDTGTLQHSPNVETTHIQIPENDNPPPVTDNPTPDVQNNETQTPNTEIDSTTNHLLQPINLAQFSLQDNVIPPPPHYSEDLHHTLEPMTAVALPNLNNYSNVPNLQNLIQVDSSSYGSHTRISSYANRQNNTEPQFGNFNPSQTNMAVSIQSPIMSSNISLNRYSMMAMPQSQQVEINVYNTLPQSKSYHDIYSPMNNDFLPPLSDFPPPIDLPSSLIGIPPPPVDDTHITTDSVLLDDDSEILKVPPPPPIDFEEPLTSFTFDDLPPPLPSSTPPPLFRLPALPKTPPPPLSRKVNQAQFVQKPIPPPLIKQEPPSVIEKEPIQVTAPLTPPPIPPPPLTELLSPEIKESPKQMSPSPPLTKVQSVEADKRQTDLPISLAESSSIVLPSLPTFTRPKKIPPPVPVKRSQLSRAFHSEEKLLDCDEPKGRVSFSKPIVSPRPLSLIVPSTKLLGFNSGNLGKFGTAEKPPQSPQNNAQKQSVSDRKKFFETAMEESHKPTKPGKVFSYLSADELEKLKAEEERKIANLSTADINSLNELDHSDAESVESQRSRPSSTIGIVRTAKAEKRVKDRMKEEGLLTDEDDTPLSPAEERALRAEKRAAWRAARLKSLEQDAIQAQMVIKSMTDMVGSGELPIAEVPGKEEGVGATNSIACHVQLRPSSADFPKLAVRTKPGNTTVRESEKVLGETITRRTEEYVDEQSGERRVRTVEYVEKLIEREVEQIQEKIISLELTKPDDLKLDVSLNGNNLTSKDEEGEDDESVSEPPTPTTDQERTLDSTDGTTNNKKKRRKRSKKGKH